MGAWLFRAPAPVAGIEVDAALQAQSAEISSAREDAQRQMDALSVHLGELQARLVRLDALGERLTELADVDPDEFDFSLSVGQGGVDEPLEGSAYAPPSFMATLDELAARLDTREQQLEVLEQLLADKHISQSTYLAGQPVRQGYISSPFGRRVNPVSGRLSMHKGIDFAAPAGSDVVAVAAGVVTWSGARTAMATWSRSGTPMATPRCMPITRRTWSRSVTWSSAARCWPRSAAPDAPPATTYISK